MALLNFEELEFAKKEDSVRVYFLRIFYFEIEKKELEKIGKFKIEKSSIEFKEISQIKAEHKFNHLLSIKFNGLKNKVTGKKTIYINRFSGIPLIGSIYFGILDRNTNIIEIRPMTGCNLSCIYCSVDEGRGSKKQIDYVVEKDYLIDELKKFVEYKGSDDMEAHINAQGEPLLYAPIVDLVKSISKIKEFKIISIDTNMTLLNEKLADQLIAAGLTRFNLSLNALSNDKADEIAGCNINSDKIKRIISYLAGKVDLIIAPIYLHGINDKEIEEIIVFVKGLNKKISDKEKPIVIGIQNFLKYRTGRNPVKELDNEIFIGFLKSLEKKYDIRLILSEGDFNIKKTKPLPKVFEKEEVIYAEVVCAGRLKHEYLAVVKNRVVQLSGCFENIKEKQKIKAKITKVKHNINYAQMIR